MLSKVFNKLSANTCLIILLCIWWLINIVQASFTELANDEAYYWLFSNNLDWGYFDHPPFIALLIYLGSFIEGELGVRFFPILLQPFYLYILWHIIKPSNSSWRDAILYFIICSAIPILQLYGFLAVPDATLLFSCAIFLLSYKFFIGKSNITNTLFLGFAMALMAYSKYHGALVVIFTIASNPKILKNYKLYCAGLFTIALYFPHLLWQWNHDFISFKYHLFDRNSYFSINYLFEYLLSILLVFNPFFIHLYVKAYKEEWNKNLFNRALAIITFGFLVFFLISSVRGQIQPQWIIVIIFGLITFLFNYVKEKNKLRKYIVKIGVFIIILFTIIRIEFMFNPLNIKEQIFNNKISYNQIANAAKGKQVFFNDSFYEGAKYMFYTGMPAYTQASINYRTHHWQLLDYDTERAGQDAIIGINENIADSIIHLAKGTTFSYKLIHNIRPLRKVVVDFIDFKPSKIKKGDTISCNIKITNPYNYNVSLSPNTSKIAVVYGKKKKIFKELISNICVEQLKPQESVCKKLKFAIPKETEVGEYKFGLVIIPDNYINYWFASKEYHIEIE